MRPITRPPTDANTDNVYEVQVAVSDGTANTTQNISVTVTPTISISAESGTHQLLEGTWFVCVDRLGTADPDGSRRFFFTGKDLVFEEYRGYESADGSCTGQEMATMQEKFSVTVLDDFVTSGWVDDTDTVSSAPTNQANTGLLQSNPLVTKLNVTLVSETPPDSGTIGKVGGYFFYMDDTDPTWCIFSNGGADEDLDYVSNSEAICKEGSTITPLASTIYAESATMQLLDGYWHRDCSMDFDTGHDYVEELIFATGTFAFKEYNYTSSDASCSSGETVTLDVTGTFTTGENFVTLGWVDENGTPASAPSAQSGSGTLAASPIVTKLTIDIPPGSLAGTHYEYFFIDDTASTWCMYGASDASGTDTDGDNYSNYLYNQEPYCKVSNP